MLVLGICSLSAAADQPPQTCFTPGQDCTALIVRQIAMSQSEILVQAYSFTSQPITQALIDAQHRGVEILVVLDKSQRRQPASQASVLAQAGIPVMIDSIHAIAHNKVMVFDLRRTLTGSFNFTAAAQHRNAENIILLDDPLTAQSYSANIRAHAGHSMPLDGADVISK